MGVPGDGSKDGCCRNNIAQEPGCQVHESRYIGSDQTEDSQEWTFTF